MEAKLIKLEDGEYDLLVYTNLKNLAGTKLSFKNCQSIERGYDLDELAREEILYNDQKREWWKSGFQKALELMKHRLPEETEWDVEVEMDILNEYDQPKLDADGCLILKRV